MSTIRPRFPTDRKVVNEYGSITPAWDYFIRDIVSQLPRPGWISVSTQQNNLEINTNGRTSIDYRLDGTTYLDTTLHFPTLTNDITNIGLVTTLKSVGTPTSASFSKITTDYAGRVSAVTPVLTSDITNLVDSVYVNVTGDTMTGDLTVPNIAITGITLLGAVGLTLVNAPATVGLAYNTSPRLNVDVFSSCTLPNTVAYPYAPLAISCVITPKIYNDGDVPLAKYLPTSNASDVAPTKPTTDPLVIVDPVVLRTRAYIS